MLSFLSSSVGVLLLLTNCTDKVALTPTTPVVTTPTTQTIIDAAPLPTKNRESLVQGALHPMAYPSLITGKIDYESTLRVDALPLITATTNLGELVQVGQPLRMVALGGSLTAGIRNGGLYREGQLTAYPNLVARQMGIADFQSPAFGTEEANGTGFMVYDESPTGYPRWREVANQKAIVQAGDPPLLSVYTGRVCNYAVPAMSGEAFDRQWHPEIQVAPYENGHQWLDFQPYLWRFLSSQENQQISLTKYIAQSKTYDFFILEDRAEGWLNTLKKNDFLDVMRFNYEFTIGQFNYKSTATALATGGKKGVVMTIPDFQDYAFMQWYLTEDLKKKAAVIDIVYRDQRYAQKDSKLDPTTQFYLMPTPTVAKLFETLKQGDYVNPILTDADVMDEAEARASNPSYYNEQVRKMAKDLKLALVDLNALYKRIHQGGYTTDDGLKIDGSPKGNFFSSDGTYPTAIGQAVIANEVIKAINSTYQSHIPLMNVQEFVRTTGAK